MTIYPDSIGVFADDGTIQTEAANCALTGVNVLNQHHVVQRLDKTHFVRVLAQLYPRLTDDVRAELLASTKTQSKKSTTAAEPAKE